MNWTFPLLALPHEGQAPLVPADLSTDEFQKGDAEMFFFQTPTTVIVQKKPALGSEFASPVVAVRDILYVEREPFFDGRQ